MREALSRKCGRFCVRCGCTEDDCRQCIERTGMPCHWVSDGLCSACDFQIERGGDYACRDGLIRHVIDVRLRQVKFRAGKSKPYTMTLARFAATALRRLDTPTAAPAGGDA